MRATITTLITAAVLTFAAAAQASTITVTTTADPADATCPDASNCSLRAAINSAAAGDTIQLAGTDAAPSVYSLTQGAQLLIAQDLTIQGNGPDATVIDGAQNVDAQQYTNRIMKVTGGTATISGLTMRNGNDDNDEYGHSGTTLNFSGGGALFVAGGTAALTDVGLLNNRAGVGGAISTTSTLQMTNVWFRDNGGGGFGGGIFERSGTVTGTGVTFDSNGGIGDGGAAMLYAGTMTLTNSTTYNNGAASSRGGGIQNYNGTLHLLNDTLAQDLRGSLETYYGTTTAENTIIGAGFSDGGFDYACVAAGKTNGDGWTSSNAITTDLGYNIDEDGHCGLTGVGHQTGVDAGLVPLADNGGPVKTYALLNGGGALDAAGSADCPLTDARGTARPQGAACDVGAFEAVRFGAPTAATDAASNPGSTDATLNATINLDGEAGGYHFIWGSAANALSNTTAESAAGVVSTDTPVGYDLTGLSPGRTYYYQAVADNASGSTNAQSVQSFTTAAGPPDVENESVESVTDTTAKLDFQIDPNGDDTSYYIAYGSAGANNYDQQTEPIDIGSTPGVQSLTLTLTGLTPGANYDFQVVATNSIDSAASGDVSFTTDRQVTGVTGSPVTVTDTGESYVCPTATIDWGDGSAASAGTVQCSPGAEDEEDYTLTATHTYATPGHYPVVIDYGGPTARVWAQITQAAQRALTLTLAGTGSGSVTGGGIDCPGTCSDSQANGASVTLKATPADGSTFTGWSGDCSGAGDCVLSMSADRAVTATFTKNPPADTTPTTPTPTPSAPAVENPPPPAAPAVPLPLSCSRGALVLLDVHLEGRHVVVAGLALPKYAGRTVAIKPSSRKAPGGSAVVQDDGTFGAQLAAPSKRLRAGIRYTARIGKQRSKALKLVRKLVITREKPVTGGLRVSGVLLHARKGSKVTVTQQLTCHHRTIFKVIKARRHGRFSVTLPSPTGTDDLAFYRLDANAGKGKTDSLPVVVRAT